MTPANESLALAAVISHEHLVNTECISSDTSDQTGPIGKVILVIVTNISYSQFISIFQLGQIKTHCLVEKSTGKTLSTMPW